MTPITPVICLTLPGYPEPNIAIAASRSGGLGVLDLEYEDNLDAALAAAAKLARFCPQACGVKVDLSREDFASTFIDRLPREIPTIIIARPCVAKLPEQIHALQRGGRTVLVEA